MSSQASFAIFSLDDFPIFPKLSTVGDFNPSLLQRTFNQFTDDKPDYDRETRMIGEIEEAVMDGDVEYLPLENDKEVFSIYMEPDTDAPKGGVIILHSRGYHAHKEIWVHNHNKLHSYPVLAFVPINYASLCQPYPLSVA